MFHLWLISATGSVATEQPHPINAIFTESGWSRISSKNASRDFPRLHCNRCTKRMSHPVNECVRRSTYSLSPSKAYGTYYADMEENNMIEKLSSKCMLLRQSYIVRNLIFERYLWVFYWRILQFILSEDSKTVDVLQGHINGGNARWRVISETSVGDDEGESDWYFCGRKDFHTGDSDYKC